MRRITASVGAAVLVGALAACGSSSSRSGSPAITNAVRGAPLGTSDVLFVGDSYTVGIGATQPSLGWAPLTAGRLHLIARRYAEGGAGWGRAGVPPATNGATTRLSVPDLAAQAAALGGSPRLIVVAAGLNDEAFDVPSAAVAAGVRLTVATLRTAYPQAPLAIIGPWNIRFPIDAVDATADREVGAAATSVGVPYLSPDHATWLPSAAMLGPDGTHPSDAGHAAIAAAAATSLATLITR